MLLSAGVIAVVSAFGKLSSAIGPATTAMKLLQGVTGPAVDSVEDIVEVFEVGEKNAEEFAESLELLIDKYGELGRQGLTLSTVSVTQADALAALRKEYIGYAEALGMSGEQMKIFTDRMGVAFNAAVNMGGDVAANFESNMRDVFKTFSIAYEGMLEVTTDGTIVITNELGEQGAATEDFATTSINAYKAAKEALSAFYAWTTAEAVKWEKATRAAFKSVEATVLGVEGPITSVTNKIRDAYRGYTEDLPEAEKTLASLAEVTGDLTEEQEAMRDSALEVRDSVTNSWASLAVGVASSMNSFLNSVSAMVRSNRELKKSHKETLEKAQDPARLQRGNSPSRSGTARRDRYRESSVRRFKENDLGNPERDGQEPINGSTKRADSASSEVRSARRCCVD